jgi:protein-tyrosine phosphatase
VVKHQYTHRSWVAVPGDGVRVEFLELGLVEAALLCTPGTDKGGKILVVCAAGLGRER